MVLVAILLAGALAGCGAPASGGASTDDLSLSEAAQEAVAGESSVESSDGVSPDESTQGEAPAAAASPETSQQKEDGAAMAVTENTRLADLASNPATYAVVGDRDGIAPASIMEQRIRGLQRAGVPADIVVFPGLSHGFGTGEGTAAGGWLQGALDFWLAHR